MTGVDVQQRKGNPPRRKGLARQMRADDRILAAGEEQTGPLELRRHFPQYVDRFRLKLTQVPCQGSGMAHLRASVFNGRHAVCLLPSILYAFAVFCGLRNLCCFNTCWQGRVVHAFLSPSAFFDRWLWAPFTAQARLFTYH